MRAGYQQRKLQELPSVQRQLRYLLLIDHFTEAGVAHVQQRYSRRHLHLLRDGSGLQNDVQPDALVDGDRDRHRFGREAGELDPHRVSAGEKTGKLERTAWVGRHGSRKRVLGCGQRDGRARSNQALLVAHGAGQRCRASLRMYGNRYQREAHCRHQCELVR
jgi:hypothetical protein